MVVVAFIYVWCCYIPSILAFTTFRTMGASRLLKIRQTSNDMEIRPEGKSADLLDDDPHKIANSLNVDGNLYVAESCIGCGACQWMCPSVFAKGGLRSYVKKQPENNDESLAAFAAMSTCPAGAIHTRAYDAMIEKAKDVFPAEIDPVNLPGVYHAGFHIPENFGSTPYFIKRAGGNVLIGTPRFIKRYHEESCYCLNVFCTCYRVMI